MSRVRKKLKIIVFKACLAASWTDESMSSDEKRYLSHLAGMLSETDEEREAFRNLTLQDINETLLLSEVEALDADDKIYVFDTCFDILKSDKRLSPQELRFLSNLAKACNISRFSYLGKILRARKYSKVKIVSRRAFFAFAIFLIIVYGVFRRHGHSNYNQSGPEDAATPKENCSGKEISVSIMQFTEADKPSKKAGQDIFKHVQTGIVSIKVFNRDKALCSGSGFVVGTDVSNLFYIVTNKHVIHNELTKKGKSRNVIRFEVQQHSGAKFDAKLDYYSRDHDLAILSAKGMDKYAEPLKLTLKSDLSVGQSVYAVGTPIGLKDTFTAGVISALRDKYLQTDATIYYGSSGGPLVDAYGGVCGVVTRGYNVKDYSFAIYSDKIIETLKKRKSKIKTKDKKK
ncbi:MAG: trypsin-like peptidase domain-containing protein [Planctomycetota bacterium]|jgi:S1-C subfamily serine protease